MLIEFRHVHEDIDRHSNVRIYFWRGKGHRKVRIREKKKDRSKVVTYRHVDARPEFMEMMRGWFDASHPGGHVTICQPLACCPSRSLT